MAEYVQHITICDRCRAGEQGEGQLFYPFVKLMDRETGKIGNVMLVVRGVFRGGFDLAATMGWQERDYGHACPECVGEELADDAFNGAEGTVTGAIYEAQLPGADEDVEEVVTWTGRQSEIPDV